MAKKDKVICPTCKGNGFVRITNFEADEMIHQCWDCDSYLHHATHVHVLLALCDTCTCMTF